MLLLKRYVIIIFPFLLSFAAHLLDETDPDNQCDSAVHKVPLQLTSGGKSLPPDLHTRITNRTSLLARFVRHLFGNLEWSFCFNTYSSVMVMRRIQTFFRIRIPKSYRTAHLHNRSFLLFKDFFFFLSKRNSPEICLAL